MDCDLTTALNNYALTCEGHARECRAAAEAARAKPRANDFPEYNRVLDRDAAQADREAALWDRRGAEARKGFLLLDPSDVAYGMENQRLVAACQAAHRVSYIDPASDGTSI